jgi:hypothetical protein
MVLSTATISNSRDVHALALAFQSFLNISFHFISFCIIIDAPILQFFGLPTIHPDARTASHEYFRQFVLLVALREKERERW